MTQSESETSNSDLEQILKYKDEFYETNKKNVFFKSSQKRECAESICNKISLVDLMNQTFWIVPNKNQMYFDYRIFKLYGHPANYNEIVDNVLRFCSWCIDQYGDFEIHVNLASFTVSGAERYRDIIICFCEECTRRVILFSTKLTTMNLYNIPNSIDQISKLLLPLIPPEVRPKLRLHKKEDSGDRLTQIYADSGKTYVA